MSFNTKDIKNAERVSNFMLELTRQHPERSNFNCIPFGDMAYAQALTDWYKNGCPKKAFFSYADGEYACPCLMEFRKELTKEFGLPILTNEEAKEENKKHQRVLVTKVHDWGLN